MKRLAVINSIIEITTPIINYIRDLISNEKYICERINLRFSFRSVKDKKELFNTIKNDILMSATKSNYTKVNQYLLKEFEYEKNKFYVVDKYNTRFNSEDSNRINGIWGSFINFFNTIWPDKWVNDFIDKHYFFIQTYKDLIHILNVKSLRSVLFDAINTLLLNRISDTVAIDIYDNNIDLSVSINNAKKDLYNVVFNIIKNIFIDQKLFKIEFIENNKLGIRLNIALADIEKFTKAIIAHKEFIKLINKQININNEQFQENLEKRKIDKIGLIDMKSGETREIDGYYFWWNNSHDTSYKCIVYINGNVLENKKGEVSGDVTNQRVHHDELIDQYMHDMSLHKHDNVIKTETEWNKIDIYNDNYISVFRKELHTVRAVMKHNIITLIDGGEYTDEAVQAFKQYYGNIKILGLSDDMSNIHCHQAKFNKYKLIHMGKRLMKKL